MNAIRMNMLVCVLSLVGMSALRAAEPAPTGPSPRSATASRMPNDAELEAMLERMGCDFAVEDSEDKSTRWFHVKIRSSGLGKDVTVSLSLSPNRKKLWGDIALADLSLEERSNSEALLKLLEKNAEVGPNHFRVGAKRQRLFLARCSDARDLNPVLLREHIDNLVEGCEKSKDDWNPGKWISGSVKK